MRHWADRQGSGLGQGFGRGVQELGDEYATCDLEHITYHVTAQAESKILIVWPLDLRCS